ncbi:hypothetical protein ICW40_15900 [Actinotalea ferrariae]|uniref:hypothetical protein n=1 Tax=Actinotalea ferrariae TaxID=1386098 RepID=UPI001C8C4907|nr:hypothetical protein [Actinotalea ferrariae]MBX9246282.1 hypothetical protein [Actinotalea ferrariae]
MRLLGVEVRRLLARRMLLAAALAGVAAVVLITLGIWSSTRPLTQTQLDAAERAYQAEVERWEADGDEMLADCEEAEAAERDLTGDDVDFGCDQMEPQRQWFFPERPAFGDVAADVLATSSVLLLVLVLVVGVSATAAEISTGALGTWLTFVPQRLRVLASKLASAGVVALPLVAGLLVLLLAGLWVAHAVNGAAGGTDAEAWRDIAGTALRILALGALAGVVGAALGVLLRHTAAALGLLVGWALVVESIVAGLVPALQPWLLRTSVAAWVQDGTTYWTTECTVTADGTSCQGVEHHVSLTHGSLWLLALTVVLVLLTGAVFRRRDVV